jgi:hypothetical protein
VVSPSLLEFTASSANISSSREGFGPHALGGHLVVVVAEADVGVEHHHLVQTIRLFLREDIPLMLARTILVGAPTLSDHRFIVIIVESTRGIGHNPRSIVPRVLRVSPSDGVHTHQSGGCTPGPSLVAKDVLVQDVPVVIAAFLGIGHKVQFVAGRISLAPISEVFQET